MKSAYRPLAGAAILAALSLAIPPAMAANGPASAPALFTTSQAQSGAQLYSQQCASCHAGDLSGNVGPALKGSTFRQMAAAQDLTAQSLLEVVSQSMPKTNPGGLSAGQYDAIIAYILQQNGYPAGSTKLTGSEAGLKSLKLAK